MNREILFRGKRVDNGEWVYGHYSVLYTKSGSELLLTHYIMFQIAGHGVQNVRVHKDSVGQYVGLTDKNGVKIFEGDILIVPGGAWGIVVWKAPFFEVTISETESSLYSREWLQECEVFGNRFDNPELIQQS